MTAFLGGLFFLQLNMGKNMVYTVILKIPGDENLMNKKNMNCKTEQTVHKEFTMA